MVRTLILFVFILAIANVAQIAHADPLANLKRGTVWANCESYFNSVERHKRNDRHYKIKDVSFSFLKMAKTLRPRSKKEAYLFIECVNLANGNASQAHIQIRKDQADDDKFFNMARNDATNNSNASQHRYMSKLDGKYQFGLEIESGKAQFEAEMEEARRVAFSYIMQTYNIALASLGGQPNYGSDFGAYGYNSYGGNPNTQLASAFLRFAQATNQIYFNSVSQGPAPGVVQGSTASWGSTNQATLAPGNYTVAPPGPTASQPTQVKLRGKVLTAPTTPPPVLKNSAPLADPKCASHKIVDNGLIATVSNKCDYPIEWRWCWIPKGKASCEPDFLSGKILTRQTVTVHGPDSGEQAKPIAIVCDMSEKGKYCRR